MLPDINKLLEIKKKAQADYRAAHERVVAGQKKQAQDYMAERVAPALFHAAQNRLSRAVVTCDPKVGAYLKELIEAEDKGYKVVVQTMMGDKEYVHITW